MEIVNGYPCFNCTDVANARRNIDPAHPKEAAGTSEGKAADKSSVDRGDAVSLSARVKSVAASDNSQQNTVQQSPAAYQRPGSSLDISV